MNPIRHEDERARLDDEDAARELLPITLGNITARYPTREELLAALGRSRWLSLELEDFGGAFTEWPWNRDLQDPPQPGDGDWTAYDRQHFAQTSRRSQLFAEVLSTPEILDLLYYSQADDRHERAANQIVELLAARAREGSASR